MAERTPARGREQGLEVDRLASRDDEEEEVSRAAADAGRRRAGPQGWAASLGAARFLLAAVVAVAVIVGTAVAVGAGRWWVLPVAAVVLLGAVGGGAYLALRATTEVEKPAPETVARLEEEGVRAPESALNERLDAEEQSKVTPSSSASRPVGPGDGN